MDAEQIILDLEQGNVVIIATDTLFALSCDAANHAAVDKIYSEKNRHKEKKLPILFKNLESVQNECIMPPILEKIAQKFWPGPLTILLEVKNNTTLASNSYDNTRKIAAVRVPGPSPILDILTRYNQPLIGTSANKSGLADNLEEDSLKDYFGSLPLLGQKQNLSGMQSTIITLKGLDQIEVVREGALSLNQILLAL